MLGPEEAKLVWDRLHPHEQANLTKASFGQPGAWGMYYEGTGRWGTDTLLVIGKRRIVWGDLVAGGFLTPFGLEVARSGSGEL